MKRYHRSRRMIASFFGRSGASSRNTPTENTKANLQRVVDLLQQLALEQPQRLLHLEVVISGMLRKNDHEPENGE